MKQLTDRVAVVTGASSGIGRATAIRLAAKGCRVALADIAMQLFALESVVLRSEKTLTGASEAKRANLDAVVKVYAFDASEKFASAARRALSFIESDNSAALRQGITPFCSYNTDGLLQAKRTLANAASESEKYLF